VKQKFRLILPMDFGDGKVQQPGDIVELDAPMAKDYAHGLILVEEETHGGNE
jgi:hypothetical protein